MWLVDAISAAMLSILQWLLMNSSVSVSLLLRQLGTFRSFLALSCLSSNLWTDRKKQTACFDLFSFIVVQL